MPKYNVWRYHDERPDWPWAIPLTQGKFALVDEEDYQLVLQYNWCAYYDRYNWYAARGIAGKNGKRIMQSLHRFLLPNCNSPYIDHKNLDTLDNRKDNLRPSTASKNQINRPGQSNNTSGYKGVCLLEGKYWVSKITVKKQKIYLGCFSSKKDAARAYNEAAIKYFGEFAWINPL